MPLKDASNSVKLLIMVGLLISPWCLTQVVIAVFAQDEKIESMPSCPSDSMNCAHIGGGENFRMDDSLTTQLEINSSHAWEKLADYIDQNNAKILVKVNNESNYYIHFVEKTKFWQFPDDVVIQINQSDDGCIIEMQSHSRLGGGDLGVNPKRLNEIYDAIVN
jgi:uncharacterized protein (DUF1499 family)